MSRRLRLLAFGTQLVVLLTCCTSSGRTSRIAGAPRGGRSTSTAESSAAPGSDAEQIVTLRVGKANRVETGMVFRVSDGALHVGDLVVTRVLRESSLARYVSDAMMAGPAQPPSRALEEGAPDPRPWTIEASIFANSVSSSWQYWGFRFDESGAGMRWVDSPEKNRRIQLPQEVVARLQSVCEAIRFDQLRDEYSFDVADGKPFPVHACSAPSLTIRVAHEGSSQVVRVYAPWSIAETPAHPDQKHAQRILRLWETTTEVIHPPPNQWRVSNRRAREGETPSPEPASPARPLQRLTLPMGQQDGIEVGMRFPVSNDAATVGEVEVVRVFRKECLAGFVPFQLDWAVALPRPWELTSRWSTGIPGSIEAIVYEVDDRRRTIVISAGAANGVEVGMHVDVLGGSSGFARARIVKVNDEHSIASVVELGTGTQIRRGDPVWGGR
jgi:hypothetical protein